MRMGVRWLRGYDRLIAHSVDVAFALLVVAWLVYIFRITRAFYFASDDLRLIKQAGSWGGLIKPYSSHMSVLILSIYHASAEVSHLSYTPFMIAGALSLVAVPVSYFVTTRRQLGPPLAAIVAMPLLWYGGMGLRPAALNHSLALVGGIFCAAALNRGRRADGVLAAALVFSLCSAGGGVVVAGACLLHNLLMRPPLRRWLAVLVPFALWGCWWLLVARGSTPNPGHRLSSAQAAGVVRHLFLAPFYQTGLGIWPLAAGLLVAFFVYGAMQLRHGLAAGANFLVWSAAMILWALTLIQSRGALAEGRTFRYEYASLVFALLAIVPRQPIRWPERMPVTSRSWLAAAAVVVLVFGGARGLGVRSRLQRYARGNSEMGREAKGTTLVLGLGPDVIPDSTRITFFGYYNPHGSAKTFRTLLDRYGSPFHASSATADQDLVDLGIARSRLGGTRQHPNCRPIAEPLLYAGFVVHGLGVPVHKQAEPIQAPPLQLWSSESFTVDVRRYGDAWVHLAEVPARRTVFLTLPVLDTDIPWEIRAAGACQSGSRREGS